MADVSVIQGTFSEDPSSESQSSNKRKARRRNAENREFDPDGDISMTSAGSETSRNVSELESSEEEDDETLIDSESGMRIEISYVLFNQNCRIWNDPRVKKFYVEYRFLNYTFETEASLPKVQPGRRAEFNSVKAFLIDSKEKRSLLREVLKTKAKVQFTLVTEPAENDTIDCEDIG
jgi:hypothetical protein